MALPAPGILSTSVDFRHGSRTVATTGLAAVHTNDYSSFLCYTSHMTGSLEVTDVSVLIGIKLTFGLLLVPNIASTGPPAL